MKEKAKFPAIHILSLDLELSSITLEISLGECLVRREYMHFSASGSQTLCYHSYYDDLYKSCTRKRLRITK